MSTHPTLAAGWHQAGAPTPFRVCVPLQATRSFLGGVVKGLMHSQEKTPSRVGA